ncbi:sulfur carrier protein ThiS [Xylanibacillus composti]|uniref:Thiamine biosynthesis protein ThiS n=1 Tax=Xylanibacillus composti TaxID=1572762 RepID=A0A8J4H0I7_9BACL|nr:sulfur carrier protein ThiS [Xylanibacillus composti]GIQ67351.1 thiamine biosynthesis protein ThiS [Xylanibacillus composti]
MECIINGERKTVAPGATLLDLIRQHGLEQRRIIAEVDGKLVDAPAWSDTLLQEGSRIELVHFVGGG